MKKDWADSGRGIAGVVPLVGMVSLGTEGKYLSLFSVMLSLFTFLFPSFEVFNLCNQLSLLKT